jgi:hypothetical protein
MNMLSHRKWRERTFPEILGFCPEIGSLGEPDRNERRSDGKSKEKAQTGPEEDLGRERIDKMNMSPENGHSPAFLTF